MANISSLNSGFNYFVNPQLGFPVEQITSCFESSIVKIRILSFLPHLYKKIISGDKIILRMLGESCVQLLHELFYLENIWNGSNIISFPDYSNSASEAFDDKMNVRSRDNSISDHHSIILSVFNTSSDMSDKCIRKNLSSNTMSLPRSLKLKLIGEFTSDKKIEIYTIDEFEPQSGITCALGQLALKQDVEIENAISPSYIEDLFQTSSKIGLGESSFNTNCATSSSSAQKRLSDEILTLLRLDDNSELQCTTTPPIALSKLGQILHGPNKHFDDPTPSIKNTSKREHKLYINGDITEQSSCTTSVYSAASNSTTIPSEITLDTDIETPKNKSEIIERLALELNSQIPQTQYHQDLGGQSHVINRLILLFDKLLSDLAANKELLSWMDFNSEIEKSHATKDERAWKTFKSSLTSFTKIFKHRVESNFDPTKVQKYVEKESFYAINLQELKSELDQLQLSSSTKINEANICLFDIKTQLDNTKVMTKSKGISIARQALINQHIQAKQQNLKLERTVQKLNDLKLKSEKSTASLKQFSKRLQSRRQAKEKELEKLIDTYDSEMNKSQMELDILEQIEESNNQKIKHLKELFASTEEQYEEMQLTLKLKEVLKNIQAQETFKQNRAARIIQNAWRKYKIRKFRKLRKRATKAKRKPGIPGAKKISDKISESSFTSKVSLKLKQSKKV